LAVGALLLLGAFLALYPAGALAVAAHVRPRAPAWAWAAVWAAAWLLGELARAQWFTGFPWIASGYAHTQGPGAAWAPWVGVYGIGALSAWWAAAGVQAWHARRPGALWAPGAVLLLGAWLPQGFTQSAGALTVTLLQPNVPQSQKFDPALIGRNLDALLTQIERAPEGLVLTPESVLPLPLAYVPEDAQRRLSQASQHRAVMVGTFLGSDAEGWVNSLTGWQQGEMAYTYGKRHLLPFGEFIPPGFGWFVRSLGIPMDDQARGQHQRPWLVAGQRLRPLICYEDLFGEDIVASAVEGPEAATVFVNASNLAWFGRLMVQDQHLQFSQMRALEFQRPVVRSTNTGATAHVDHRGRVLARLAPLTEASLTVTVEGRQGSTPYARWLAAAGLWPLWGLGAAVLLPWWTRRRGGAIAPAQAP
jgi:apolipoprotein N-acyltransferase